MRRSARCGASPSARCIPPCAGSSTTAAIEVVEPDTVGRDPDAGHRLARRRPRRRPSCAVRAKADPAHQEGLPHHRPRARPVSLELLLDADAAGDDERTFALKVAFCGNLDPEARLELLERRRADARRPASRAPDSSSPRTRRPLHALPARAPHPVHPARPRVGRRAHRGRSATRLEPDAVPDRHLPERRSTCIMSRSHPRRHRRSRQLREQPRAGRRVLPQRRPDRGRAGSHARRARRLPRRRRRLRRRVRRRRRQGRARPRQGHLSPGRTTPSSSPTSASSTSRCSARPTFDGLGKYYRETIEESPAAPVDVAQVAARHRAPTCW